MGGASDEIWLRIHNTAAVASSDSDQASSRWHRTWIARAAGSLPWRYSKAKKASHSLGAAAADVAFSALSNSALALSMLPMPVGHTLRLRNLPHHAAMHDLVSSW